jgi:O-antigen/teichoic acid export membrane protein
MTVSEAAGHKPPRGLVHGTAWMMAAQGGGLVCQVGYFILITRALGISHFGALAASLALVSIFAPFAAWGWSNILVMDVARRPAAFSVAFGNSLAAVALSSLVLIPLTVGLGAAFLHKVPVTAILLLALADLGFGRVLGMAAPGFQALGRLGEMTFVSLLGPAMRFVAVLVFTIAWSRHDLVTWTAIYLVGTVITSVFTIWEVSRRLGRPTFRLGALRGQVKLGGYFAVAASATTIYADIDKAMLARLSTLDATGLYAAADRAVNMAFMPVMAMLAAAYPHFFRAGMTGIAGSTAYARRLLPAAAGYGLVAGCALYLLAPIAPHILGSDFRGSVDALRWLAPIPLLSALYYLAADALTGADAQGRRTILQICAAALNVLLNVLLIPDYSWRGAAWSTIATMAFLAISLWIATIHMNRSSSIATPSIGSAG